MRFLLDTHVLLWLLGDPALVPSGVRDRLADRSNELLVSAVSAIEVATKARLGRLDAARPLVDAWSGRLSEIGAFELPVTAQHGLVAGSMTWEHRDPFDRLLVAQAFVENLTLVTTDRAIVGLPGLRTVDW